jgi:Flp pilus assembly protein TadD
MRRVATARQWFALSLSAEERYGEAEEQIRRARETDPLSRMIASDAANVYRRAGHLDKARDELRASWSQLPHRTDR